MWRTAWFVMYNHQLHVKLGIYRVAMLNVGLEEVHEEMGLCPHFVLMSPHSKSCTPGTAQLSLLAAKGTPDTLKSSPGLGRPCSDVLAALVWVWEGGMLMCKGSSQMQWCSLHPYELHRGIAIMP